MTKWVNNLFAFYVRFYERTPFGWLSFTISEFVPRWSPAAFWNGDDPYVGKPNHPIRLRFRWSCFTKKGIIERWDRFSARFLMLKVQVVSLEWFCLHFAAAKEDEIGVTSFSTKFVVTLTLCAWVDMAKVYFLEGSYFEISESSIFVVFPASKGKLMGHPVCWKKPMPNRNLLGSCRFCFGNGFLDPFCCTMGMG